MDDNELIAQHIARHGVTKCTPVYLVASEHAGETFSHGRDCTGPGGWRKQSQESKRKAKEAADKSRKSAAQLRAAKREQIAAERARRNEVMLARLEEETAAREARARSLRRDWERTRNVGRLSDEYGISRDAMRHRLAVAGIVVPRQPPEPRQYDIAEIVADYRAGMSLVTVCRKHHCGKHAVKACLHDAGVPLRTHAEAMALRPTQKKDLTASGSKLRDQQRAQIYAEVVRRYEDGETAKHIAVAMGMGDRRVRRILNARGIALRTRWQTMTCRREYPSDAECIRVWREIGSLKRAASVLRVRREYLTAVFERNGIDAKDEGRKRRIGTRIHRRLSDQAAAAKDDVLRLYAEGMTMKQVAGAVGLSASSVNRLLHRFGVEVRENPVMTRRADAC